MAYMQVKKLRAAITPALVRFPVLLAVQNSDMGRLFFLAGINHLDDLNREQRYRVRRREGTANYATGREKELHDSRPKYRTTKDIIRLVGSFAESRRTVVCSELVSGLL